MIKKMYKLWPPFEVFRCATASPIFSVESRTSEECVDLFLLSNQSDPDLGHQEKIRALGQRYDAGPLGTKI